MYASLKMKHTIIYPYLTSIDSSKVLQCAKQSWDTFIMQGDRHNPVPFARKTSPHIVVGSKFPR